jgi:hypothetical protein
MYEQTVIPVAFFLYIIEIIKTIHCFIKVQGPKESVSYMLNKIGLNIKERDSIYNRPVGVHSSEMQSHPIDMNKW